MTEESMLGLIANIRSGKRTSRPSLHCMYTTTCSGCGGAAFILKIPESGVVYCDGKCAGKARSGDKAHNWKGGVASGPGFYVRVKSKRGPGYAQEHREVVADFLGRPLAKFENVHHKNGKRDDNRIENLELWAKPQPCGQRVEDLMAWVFDNYNKELRAKIEIQDLVRSVIARVSERA